MRRFEHAAARRDLAEAVVVRLEFRDGTVGWGETLPRPYVTGESIESVAGDLAEVIWPACRRLDFDEMENFARIPATASDGRCMNAAACAFELAAAVRQMDRTGGAPASPLGTGSIAARVSGVLGSADPARTARRLRMMRLLGLRDFKLKLGLGEEADRENLRIVYRRLGRALAAGKVTLRVDVNGGWSAHETPERTAALKAFGVCAVEQPVFCPAEELADLAERCELPLMADESLITVEDARRLARSPEKLWWNIRISKNGGLFGALALARNAHERGVAFTVGCMVGESGILSAAQRRLLEWGPQPRFVEGNYGRLLLRDDLTRPSLRFGWGGRLRPLSGPGLGVDVDPHRLGRYGRLLRSLRA